jgi:cell division protein FtsB
MVSRSRKRRSVTRFIAPLATLVILGYFGFHAFNGQYGIRANLVMQQRMVDLEVQLAQLTARRSILEDQVALLREGSMEKDMVDQHVRAQLNMLREDEVVLFINR